MGFPWRSRLIVRSVGKPPRLDVYGTGIVYFGEPRVVFNLGGWALLS